MKLSAIPRTFLSIILTLIVLFWFTSSANAQRFYAGHIIQDGTQKDGLISYTPSKSDNSSIVFKSKDSSNPEILTSDQVSEFYLDEYRSSFIAITEKTTNKKVYTEVQLRGELTLSYYQGFYVLLKRDGEMFQLYLPLKKNMYDDKKEVVNMQLAENKVIGSLKLFLKDCPQDKFDLILKDSHLTNSTLKSIVKAYNECKGVEFVKRGGKRSSLGVVAGVVFNNLTFNDPYLADAFDPQLGYKIGLTYDILPQSYHSRFVVNAQAVLMKSSYKLRPQYATYLSDANLDNTTFRLPLGVKIYTGPGQTGLFFHVNISPVFVIDQHTSTLSSTNQYRLDYRSFTMAWSPGIGWEGRLSAKHRIVGTLRYESNITPTFEYATSQGTISSFQADVAFKF